MIACNKPVPDLAGTVLEGAYRLVRLIGHGGMGAVYEATQLRLGKRVAIKLMSQSSVSDQVSLARFHQEAEVTSKLGHPHLVNVVDFGTAESGQPYMVMEYLEGEDLDHRLRRSKPVPPETAARIVVQTASALGAAHAQGVVHRDMKPGNIFLLHVPGEPEFVKVLDFGISKIRAANAKRLTSEKMVVGTPYYMSPEQALGHINDVDHRADQWALACIAWEMLCGRPPFVADDVTAVMFQITRIEPKAPDSDGPGFRPEVEEVLRRALRKRHVERYPSIREFGRAFECAVLGYSTEQTPTPMLALSPQDGQTARANQTITLNPVGDAFSGSRWAQIARFAQLRIPGWAVIVGAAALALILLALGMLRFHPSTASKTSPKDLQPAAAPTEAMPPPLPTPTITRLPDSTPLDTAEAAPSTKHAKAKPSKDVSSRGQSKPKRTPAKAKHRLFEEL